MYMGRYIFIKEAWGSGILAKTGELQTVLLIGDFFTSCQEE